MLSNDEKARIDEEEKIRIRTRDIDKRNKNLMGCLIILGFFIVVVLLCVISTKGCQGS